MEITVSYRGKEKKLNINKDKVTAGDILKALDLSSDYAFIAVNGEVVSEDYIIKETDKIKVVNAISGG